MLSDAAKYGIVAGVMILVMFMLFVNVAKMNLAKKRAIAVALADDAKQTEQTKLPEQTSVYPLYVDCTVSSTTYELK